MLFVIRQESFKALSIVSMESMESIEKGNEEVKPTSNVHNPPPYLLIVDCVHTIQGVTKKTLEFSDELDIVFDMN